MDKLLKRAPSIVCLWLGLLAGCAAETTDTGSVDVARESLTDATLTTLAPWVVFVEYAGLACSASVLSEHYLLTAGHCATDVPNPVENMSVSWANQPGRRAQVYFGRGRFYVNDHYHAHDASDRENDMALIFLETGGIDLSITGRARLWNNVSQPWTSTNSADRDFVMIGWGLGDPNCADGTAALKRYGIGVTLDRTEPYPLVATAEQRSMHTCEGDSGSPWLFQRDGQLIAFAVTSGTSGDIFDITNTEQAPFLPPKMDWISGATNLTGIELDFSVAGFADGEAYEECLERRLPPPPPPPPGAECPSTQHCCNGNPNGPKCLQCISKKLECP